jgi:hypothetical protein
LEKLKKASLSKPRKVMLWASECRIFMLMFERSDAHVEGLGYVFLANGRAPSIGCSYREKKGSGGVVTPSGSVPKRTKETNIKALDTSLNQNLGNHGIV